MEYGMRRARAIGTLCLLTLFGAAGLPAQQVSGLSAAHGSGQTFLTWKAAEGAISYIVYRSESPIRTGFSLRAARRIARVSPGSSVNHRLSSLTGNTEHFVLPNRESPLGQNDEVLVVTAGRKRRSYYAVTAQTEYGEMTAIDPGRNATAAPLFEKPGSPRPVLQKRVPFRTGPADVYVHWVSNVSIAGMPAMTNTASYAFNIGLLRRGTAPLHPLLVRFHGRGDNFLRQLRGSGNPEEWVLALDDDLPGGIHGTFWFGYHQRFDIFARTHLPPIRGTVVDYTLRRIRWTLNWVLREFPVDSTRVILSGVSMGATAALLTVQAMPGRIAAVQVFLPRMKYTPDPDPDPRANAVRNRMQSIFARLWGTPEQRLRLSNGVPVYNRLNHLREISRMLHRGVPPIRVFSGKRDTVVGWHQMIETYRFADSLRTGMEWYWDIRAHEIDPTGEWSPQQHLLLLGSARSNRSYAAVSRCSADDRPGNGLVSSGDSTGAIDAAVESVPPVIDTRDRWSIGLRQRVLETRRAPRYPEKTVRVDVTPRRLQRFPVAPGAWYACTIGARTGTPVNRILRADARGEITIADVPVDDGVTRIEIRPVAGPLPPGRR